MPKAKSKKANAKANPRIKRKEKDFSLNLTVKSSPNEVLKKIEQVDQWWAKNFKGKASKLNDKFSVYFGDTFVDFKVSEFVPGKKVVWKVTDCNLHWIKDRKEWNGSEVVWNVAGTNTKTRIHFVHSGLNTKSECYESCKPGWTHHIKASLLKLINDGQGFPE